MKAPVNTKPTGCRTLEYDMFNAYGDVSMLHNMVNLLCSHIDFSIAVADGLVPFFRYDIGYIHDATIISW